MEQCGLRRMRRFLRESAGGQSRPPLQGSGKAHPNPPGLQRKICAVVPGHGDAGCAELPGEQFLLAAVAVSDFAQVGVAALYHSRPDPAA